MIEFRALDFITAVCVSGMILLLFILLVAIIMIGANQIIKRRRGKR